MATPREKLAEALGVLKQLQDNNVIAIHFRDFENPRHREILTRNGFIKEVSKGWYISSDPASANGETTSWYTSYWDFVARFLRHKYGEDWIISPEHSLLLHSGNQSVPEQLMIKAPKGNNNSTPLIHNTSLFNLRSELPDSRYRIINDQGIVMYDLPSSLIFSVASVYRKNGIDARTSLSMIRDASELLGPLLENGHSTIAGRLAGAFRNIGKIKIADQIIDTFKQAGYDIREEDPFADQLAVSVGPRGLSPYVNRIRYMWEKMRESIINIFPAAPGISGDHESYLKEVDDIYVTDAYHSLSIERYRVTPALIAKVSSGEWNIEINEEDRKQKDAMAARGYYLAFGSVKETVAAILSGQNAGEQVDSDHSKWYLKLFEPSVNAGILKLSDLAGYRSHPVYIGNSMHVPLNIEALRDAMPVLFDLLRAEKEASVRAVLGHFIFVFIHPYMDGNGRMGRFLMNTMLASGGYPWTVIPVERREEYMQALEEASVRSNIGPFAQFISDLVRKGIEGKPVATLPS